MRISPMTSRVLRPIPVVLSILAVASCLLVFRFRLRTNHRISLSLTLHVSEDSYIQDILHSIDIPARPEVPQQPEVNVHSAHRKSNGGSRQELKELFPDIATISKHAKPAIVRAYKKYLKNLDILALSIPKALPQYKSPCWRQSPDTAPRCTHAQSGLLRGAVGTACLPYFFVIGQPSCGVQDILQQLNRHPDVALSQPPHWIDRRRFLPECSSLSTYTQYFRSATRFPRKFTRTASPLISRIITGDASDAIMSDNHLWRKLPRNQKCKEPCFTNADYVRHLNRNARILVILCDPVERLYREYKHRSLILNHTSDELDFHKLTIEAVHRFKQCMRAHSQRYCVYESTYEHPSISLIRARVGIYSTHLADWLRVFPRHRIHVTRMEDVIAESRSEIGRILDFLSVGNISSSDWKKMNARPGPNQEILHDSTESEMSNSTRKILSDFYDPHNNDLVNLLKDAKYYWKPG